MAQGLFCSLLIGTILNTLGSQTGVEIFSTVGGYASAMSGPAMAIAIGWALKCPPLVLFLADRRRLGLERAGRRGRPARGGSSSR